VLVDYVLDPDRWVDYANGNSEVAREDIDRLRREAHKILDDEEDVTIGSLTNALRYRIATREPLGDPIDETAIRIVTLWGAKGLTAEYVYLVGLADEALPGPHDPESTGLTAAEHEDEQRRLLYVSLTRAKRSLVISRPEKIRVGQVRALGLAYSAN